MGQHLKTDATKKEVLSGLPGTSNVETRVGKYVQNKEKEKSFHMLAAYIQNHEA